MENEEFKSEFLESAFSLASEALSVNEVPVGCVLVLDNVSVISSGRNAVNETSNATKHAEIVALEKLSPEFDFSRLHVYVNVEPCIMCAYALLHLRVARIYFGCYNERFGGCGSLTDIFSVYSPTSTLVRGGYQKERAITLLKEFYNRENPNAPPEKRRKKASK